MCLARLAQARRCRDLGSYARTSGNGAMLSGDPKRGDVRSSAPLRIVTWNINGFTWRRNRSKFRVLEQLDWDVACLQEVSGRTGRELEQALGVPVVAALEHVGPTLHDVPLGAVVCSRIGAPNDPVILPQLPRAERFIDVEVIWHGRQVRVASWHAPNAAGDGVDVKMTGYRIVRRWLQQRPSDQMQVLSVDTNSWESGWIEPPLDPADPFFEEHRFLRHPTVHGLRDAYRLLLEQDPDLLNRVLTERPTGALATTYVRGRSIQIPERMDRILVSTHLTPVGVEHHYAAAAAAGSDHAAVVAELAETPT
jgi:exonuclease III